jgi:hypothetical protein
MKPIGAFFDKEMAEEVSAKEGGCMGQTQKPWVEEIPVFDSLKDREEYKKGDKKRKALAKLTEEDKHILGLKDESTTSLTHRGIKRTKR